MNLWGISKCWGHGGLRGPSKDIEIFQFPHFDPFGFTPTAGWSKTRTLKTLYIGQTFMAGHVAHIHNCMRN